MSPWIYREMWIILTACFFFATSYAEEKTVIRVGHFPNLTHAQGVIGHGFTRANEGWFEKAFGDDVKVDWYVYNAGPSAMEAIFTNSIDLAFVGPNPAINAYIKSKGKEIRIISGACSGGSSLVIQPDEGIKSPQDFKGKKVGTPQFGGTQDVSARSWLKKQGFHISLTGGDVLVIPTDNPDQLNLLKNKELDAVWTIEPWVSQLILEGNAKLFLEESSLWPETNGKYITTQLVSSQRFLNEHPDLVQKWIKAQIALTEWIQKHPEEAKSLLAKELKMETGFDLPQNVLDRAWNHIELTNDPIQASLQRFADEAFAIGFLKSEPDLSGIYSLEFLKEALK